MEPKSQEDDSMEEGEIDVKQLQKRQNESECWKNENSSKRRSPGGSDGNYSEDKSISDGRIRSDEEDFVLYSKNYSEKGSNSGSQSKRGPVEPISKRKSTGFGDYKGDRRRPQEGYSRPGWGNYNGRKEEAIENSTSFNGRPPPPPPPSRQNDEGFYKELNRIEGQGTNDAQPKEYGASKPQSGGYRDQNPSGAYNQGIHANQTPMHIQNSHTAPQNFGQFRQLPQNQPQNAPGYITNNGPPPPYSGSFPGQGNMNYYQGPQNQGMIYPQPQQGHQPAFYPPQYHHGSSHQGPGFQNMNPALNQPPAAYHAVNPNPAPYPGPQTIANTQMGHIPVYSGPMYHNQVPQNNPQTPLPQNNIPRYGFAPQPQSINTQGTLQISWRSDPQSQWQTEKIEQKPSANMNPPFFSAYPITQPPHINIQQSQIPNSFGLLQFSRTERDIALPSAINPYNIILPQNIPPNHNKPNQPNANSCSAIPLPSILQQNPMIFPQPSLPRPSNHANESHPSNKNGLMFELNSHSTSSLQIIGSSFKKNEEEKRRSEKEDQQARKSAEAVLDLLKDKKKVASMSEEEMVRFLKQNNVLSAFERRIEPRDTRTQGSWKPKKPDEEPKKSPKKSKEETEKNDKKKSINETFARLWSKTPNLEQKEEKKEENV